MSELKGYQSLLKKSIHSLVKEHQVNTQSLLSEVFEQVMLAEREMFLSKVSANKANGFYTRFVQHFNGRFTLRIPRDRQGAFTPLLLEVLKHDQQKMDAFALSLYTQGVSHRQVKRLFEQFFDGRMSPGKLSQLVKTFEPKRQAWQSRSLDSHYHVVLIDALVHPVRRDTVSREATYLVMGLKADFTREILGIYHLPTETAAGWQQVFDDLKQRGIQQIGLVLCDELSGIETAIENHLPHRYLQLCWVHKLRNLRATVRHKDKPLLVAECQALLNIDEANYTPTQCRNQLAQFIQRWVKKYPSFKTQLPEQKWKYFVNFLRYPVQVRRMLYTTNWIERLNKEIRKTTRHVNSFPNPDAALNLIFMVTTQMEERTYRIPVTSFYPHKQHMDDILHR